MECIGVATKPDSLCQCVCVCTLCACVIVTHDTTVCIMHVSWVQLCFLGLELGPRKESYKKLKFWVQLMVEAIILMIMPMCMAKELVVM